MWSKAREAILKSSMSSSIYIGCDSQVSIKNGIRYADYSTVVVVHKDSKHGASVFHNHVRMRDYDQLRSRLMAEVQLSLEAFYAIEDAIGDRTLEVHLDINPSDKYASNVVAKEALGWVRSLGITAKIKPDAWAASRGADQVVRRKGDFQH